MLISMQIDRSKKFDRQLDIIKRKPQYDTMPYCGFLFSILYLPFFMFFLFLCGFYFENNLMSLSAASLVSS